MERTKAKKNNFTSRIADQKCLAPGLFLMSIYMPPFFLDAQPGQFILIRAKNNSSVFLSRPISIHSVYKRFRRVICDILYQVMGEGTQVLARLKKGDEIVINGPLGSGFDIENLRPRIVLIAGGMGVAPLRYLVEKITSSSEVQDVICYQGGRNRGALPEIKCFKELCKDHRISTDDGSMGQPGLITDLFATDLESYNDDDSIIFACGPHQMLVSLKAKMKGRQIRCQVSVEARMACGVGACLGCAVKVSSGGYACACSEGPVFELNKLDLD
jgi:dihydroorotate dehydrogenase electron transfer subunit